MPALELADLAAVRVREQLRAEAHAEHRHAARRRVPQQRGLAGEPGVERVLLAAEHHDPVVLAERGQRVAAAREALVELGARTAQRGPGVAEERALEVVDDGDPGGHPAPRLPPGSVRLLGLNTNMCSHEDDERVGRNKPLELLEREITELASHIHAATCRWLGLVAEFDRREGWAGWGYRSCAHWVSWRCSIAPGAAREHVRVARRLESLPLVRAAFAEGRLSYSKVRALTRVEDVTGEDELVMLAEHASAAQLERLLRAYRGVVAVERAEPERWVSWSHDTDGSLLLRARIPAEEGALVVAALEAGREAVCERADVPAGTPRADSAGARTRTFPRRRPPVVSCSRTRCC